MTFSLTRSGVALTTVWIQPLMTLYPHSPLVRKRTSSQPLLPCLSRMPAGLCSVQSLCWGTNTPPWRRWSRSTTSGGWGLFSLQAFRCMFCDILLSAWLGSCVSVASGDQLCQQLVMAGLFGLCGCRYNFESWREYSYLDEEKTDKAEWWVFTLTHITHSLNLPPLTQSTHHTHTQPSSPHTKHTSHTHTSTAEKRESGWRSKTKP